ncbi:MAG: c-type cytochrome [Gemmatimonadaceae bacterium]|nr:c-type cytochrome [Gemmatimonadaceae bacterium]
MRHPIRLTLATILVVAACGGGAEQAADTAVPSTTVAAVDPAALDPATITPQELALGDSLFHGLIGATSCQACHGPDGKGGTVAPDLTDATWIHSDGSYGAIYTQIETGVMQPKQYLGVMPPFGGAPLTPDKHRAVAAYVYRLSNPAK